MPYGKTKRRNILDILELRRKDSVENKRVLWKHPLWLDAKEMAETFPETFERPTDEEIRKVKEGDFVKICYTWDLEEGQDLQVHGERFWVEVEQIVNHMFIGEIANPTAYIDSKNILGAREGDRVSLTSDSILDIMEKGELEKHRKFYNEQRGELRVHKHKAPAELISHSKRI